MKRVMKVLGLLLALLVVAAGGVWYSAFGSNSPIPEGLLVPGVETVKDGFVSAFILDDKSGKAILAALQRRGLTAASVAAIFLTHGHPDHTAGCRVFPAADVYAMEADVPLVGDAAKVTHRLKDGDVSTVGDLRVEAFAVPGHTPGSAVYLAHRVLFFGDSAGASKSGEVMKAVHLFSKDPAQNVASLKALAARLQPRAAEVVELAFAHTGPLAGLGPLATFASHSP